MFDDETCPTCAEDTAPIALTVDGVTDKSATLTTTTAAIPDWYLKKGIYSSLPPHFTCNESYRPPLAPTTPPAESAGTTTLVFDLEGVADGTHVAWWATAEGASDGDDAGDAYGDFSNRGIVRTVGSTVTLRILRPAAYTLDGKTYRPHVHFVTWNPDAEHWNQERVHALNFDRDPPPPAPPPPADVDDDSVPFYANPLIIATIVVLMAIIVYVWRKRV